MENDCGKHQHTSGDDDDDEIVEKASTAAKAK